MISTSINYKSINDLNTDILNNLHKIPHDVDLIVGIPRSGMLPANLLALYLQKPFTDLDSFINGHIYSCGERGSNLELINIKKILIIDDSYALGNAIRAARHKIINSPSFLENDYELYFGVIYIVPEAKPELDFFIEKVPRPRVFEWNIFQHKILEEACCDIDGVLCLDPPIDDDGEIYLNYISNAIPYIIPKVKINTLVTCRLEKYRDVTESWLRKNGIKYEKLIMLPFKTKEERIKWGKHAEYKAEIYSKSNCILFIESSLEQAEIINRLSNKLVFCTKTFDFVGPKVKKILNRGNKIEKIKRVIIRISPQWFINVLLSLTNNKKWTRN